MNIKVINDLPTTPHLILNCSRIPKESTATRREFCYQYRISQFSTSALADSTSMFYYRVMRKWDVRAMMMNAECIVLS